MEDVPYLPIIVPQVVDLACEQAGLLLGVEVVELFGADEPMDTILDISQLLLVQIILQVIALLALKSQILRVQLALLTLTHRCHAVVVHWRKIVDVARRGQV